MTATESGGDVDGEGDLVGRRVLVELADGLNFAGTVRREYVERGSRRLLVEDSRGNERVVRPARPSVSIDVGGVGTGSLQDELRAADRRDRREGGAELEDGDGGQSA
jgi:hypothetical protein